MACFFKAALVMLGLLAATFAVAQPAEPSLPATSAENSGVPPIIVEAPSSSETPQPPAAPPPEGALRFDIARYRVDGNTLLSVKVIQNALAPHLGKQKDFSDVQHALEALQRAYQQAGYGVVQVTLPEQELESGEVRFEVIEVKLAKITVQGNKYFSEKNILASTPALQIGKTPDSTQIARNLNVANENPAKHTEVVLRNGENDGEMDAAIKVVDDDPVKYSVSFDNTGTSQTGPFRVRFGFQHANLWHRDHTLTFQYITNPEHVSKVTVFGLGYHIPLYRLGDSLDFVAGYSDVDSGTVQDLFNVSGAGVLLAARYNHNFDRVGDYEHKLVFGLDYRAYQNNVTTVGSTVALVPDITVHPASIIYNGTLHKPNSEFGFYIGPSQNIFPGGNDAANSDFQGPTPGFPDGSRKGAKAGYRIWRFGANYSRVMRDWQLRALFNAQNTDAALVAGEQFGLGGANSVRGFEERQYSDDRGYQATFEIYTPDVAKKIGYAGGHLRFLAFYDTGTVARNVRQPGEQEGISVDSAGVGVRFLTSEIFSLKMDFAYVLHDGGGDPTAGEPDGRRGSSTLHATAVWVF